jgi:hypothetical protein
MFSKWRNSKATPEIKKKSDQSESNTLASHKQRKRKKHTVSGSGARIGNRGPIGPTGPTGPEGPRGKTGKEGDDGKRGKRGYPGVTGVTGATGPQGLIGPAGATGATGPQGLIGPAGATGTTGPQGLIGPAGATGATGPQGLTGPAGATGATGPQGLIGPAGATGATGPRGLTGPAGATGATGTAINEYAFFYNDVEVTIPVTTEVTTLPLSSNGIVFGNFTHIPGQEAIIINQIGNYNVHWNVTLPSVTSTTNFVIGLRLGVTDLPGSFVGVTTTPGENTLLSGQFILNVPFPGESLLLVAYQNLETSATLPTLLAGVNNSNIQLKIFRLNG